MTLIAAISKLSFGGNTSKSFGSVGSSFGSSSSEGHNQLSLVVKSNTNVQASLAAPTNIQADVQAFAAVKL
ncbi:hypothetical protein PPL_11542 [Heterostelium album PN500]|uniref:Uncharacterized protein n=1 Tax=Heterostelium pallidum (strain ATCC 26659 / Pp 5 / PN500) TaxID=670386 RepID=D3BVF1_HETP5|nr:hypothetical protein PPL_11542 [Heterostelium album PN500]EFA74574.1 hypothetical protein PPL_11542 [Heterostelium album PN500]|eukprot:XP_020426708.1 hypothetical protein PPL_11542 [Heterostelium album PN500]